MKVSTKIPLTIEERPEIKFSRSRFTSRPINKKGEFNNFRQGLLKVKGKRVETPALFPVTDIITGPPSPVRTGGIWKWIKREMLLNDNYPYLLSQILHFADFPMRKSTLKRWMIHEKSGDKMNLHQWIEEDRKMWMNENYCPETWPSGSREKVIFLDSGGFKLLFNTDFDIEEFGYSANPESVFELQQTFGGDMVASLDYPIPPGLSDEEAKVRMNKSIKNALILMHLVQAQPLSERPFPYLAVHGQSKEQITWYVNKLLDQLDKEGFNNGFGLAIGSLVPRRHDYIIIAELVTAVISTIKNHQNFDYDNIPVHVFGVSGDMIPILSYLGVDTFDANTYVKSAQNLLYENPKTGIKENFYKLNELECDCDFCSVITPADLVELKKVLISEPYNKYTFKGMEINKSWIYAQIALHNLRLSLRAVEELKENKENIEDYIIEKAKSNKRLSQMLSYISQTDQTLAEKIKENKIKLEDYHIEESKQISLLYDFNSFNVLEEAFIPKSGKVLLIIPCSQEKPYKQSKSHRAIKLLLEPVWDKIEKVTLSGLYGPVPEEFEEREEVSRYDYKLEPVAHEQITLLTDRLVDFLNQHGDQYEKIVAYVTSSAYRSVIEKAFSRYGNGTVLPRNSKMGTTEFYRKSNLDQLKLFIGY